MLISALVAKATPFGVVAFLVALVGMAQVGWLNVSRRGELVLPTGVYISVGVTGFYQEVINFFQVALV